MRNAGVLSKRSRPEATVQLLLRLEVVQHLLIVNGTRADHPDVRLGLCANPHDGAALLASVRLHRVA